MSLFNQFMETGKEVEGIHPASNERIPRPVELTTVEQVSFDRFRRYLVASTLAFSVVIAGLCSFVIVASLAAWTVLNQ